MSIYVSALTRGANNFQTTPEHVNQAKTDFVNAGVVGTVTPNTGSGGSGGYAPNANGTPNTTTILSPGTLYLSVTPTGQNPQMLAVKSDANITITHSANSSGVVQYDWVYMTVDPALANAPDVNGTTVGSIQTIRGTSNSVEPSGSTSYPYRQLIEIVTLANGFATVTNANIADKRKAAGMTPMLSVPQLGGYAQNTPLQMRAGTFVGTTNGSGDLTITWTPAFPNGVIGQPIVSGGFAETVNMTVGAWDSNFTTSSCAVRCSSVNTTVRVNYIVFGY